MRGKEFNDIKISGMACAVPANKVNTDAYTEYFGEEVIARFKKATGIKCRHLSDGCQTASDLCYVAAKQLMDKKGLTGSDIDAIIFITQTGDYKAPSSAYVIHKRLNIKQDCLVFDINLGCSGFVNGVYLVAGLIESGVINKGLLLVGDSETAHQVTEDVSYTMMFGDAGSATLMEKGEGIVRGMIRSDGSGFKTLILPVPGSRFPNMLAKDNVKLEKKMNGEDVFLFAITKVPKLFKEFFGQFNCSFNDFDYCVLHQANLMIINQIAKKLKIDPQKVPVTLDKYGNTDGASIPISIVDTCEKMNKQKNLNFIASGFGVGLSWGIISFEIESEDVLPLIITDDYYLEGSNL